MAGHSKWKQIKHKKAKNDSARGKVFTKIIREITTAARLGGGDPDGNARLRQAIETARGANMPKENVDKAVKKGTGELPGVNYEEMTYEGYGPGGVALFIEILTDNKNRTASEVRFLLGKYGGNLGESGCVAWMFDRVGEITLEGESLNEDEVMEAAVEAGADDVVFEEGVAYVYTAMEDLFTVQEALEAKSIKTAKAVLTRIPQNTVTIEGKTVDTMLKLMEMLEDNDDVQNVYANFDIPEEILQEA